MRGAVFESRDVLTGIDLSGYDLVVVNKLISTLKRNDNLDDFIALLTGRVKSSLGTDCCLVYIDVNSVHTGRDIFHRAVRPLFRTARQFYFDDPPYFEASWTKVSQSGIVFEVSDGLAVSSLSSVAKDVIFEYWK